MTTEYKLNTYIEWTAEDRAKGECPVPEGSDVTVWLSDRTAIPHLVVDGGLFWDDDWPAPIIGYLIHSVPREPIVRWLVVGGLYEGCLYDTEVAAKHSLYSGGRVVKLVEEME